LSWVSASASIAEDASHLVEEHVDDLFALARCKAFESWV